MECKFALRAISILLILAGLSCFPAAHALYVKQKLMNGHVGPSVLVRAIDFIGFALLILAVALNILSKLFGRGMNKVVAGGLKKRRMKPR